MPDDAYADWKAPRQDGTLLLWPEVPALLAAIERNRTSLAAASTPILGVPLHELRARTRTYLGHETNVPLIATGHQTELHHPGVWVKNVVIHTLAERTGAPAFHLAVDTDQPKHLNLHYPVSRDGAEPPVVLPITDDADLVSAAWTGRVSGPSPSHATALERKLGADAQALDFEPLAPGFLASLRRLSLEEGVLPPMLVNALHQLDWSLGLRYDAILASPLWDYEGFQLFCCHLIANADRYAASYNAALADYRQQEGIDNPGRPMPDLARSPEATEIPLWLDNLSAGTRTRALARNGSISINGDTFTPHPAGGFDTAREMRDFLLRHNHRLAPRALTLTSFVRLAFADLFVHGIGGGRYDQVTDRTLRSFFHIEPPTFAVTTATLYHPWALERTRACLPCIKHQGHRLRHAVLGAGKSNYLATIAHAPRRSHARKATYLAMHAQLANAREASTQLLDWSSRFESAIRDSIQDAVIFDRELFYALQPRERLDNLIERVREAFA